MAISKEQLAKAMAERSRPSEQGTGSASRTNGLNVTHRLIEIDVGKIAPSRFQPRKVFDDAEISALAESIRTDGLIEPIVVRDGDRFGEYELIAGERRLRAVKQLQSKTILAYVRSCTTAESARLAFTENMQRENLTDIEIAHFLRVLLDVGACKSVAEASVLMGRSRTDMYRYLSFENLPTPLLKWFEENPELSSRRLANAWTKVLWEDGAIGLALEGLNKLKQGHVSIAELENMSFEDDAQLQEELPEVVEQPAPDAPSKSEVKPLLYKLKGNSVRVQMVGKKLSITLKNEDEALMSELSSHIQSFLEQGQPKK